LRAPERSDPRAWNGRPDGAGEAAEAASAVPRLSRRAGHRTLTSWRSGRLGWRPSTGGCHRPGRRVPKTERADRSHPGGAPHEGFARGVVRIRLAQQQQVSQQERGHHHADIGLGCRVPTLRRHLTLRRLIGGEFDPGSGSTLAACLMHASRARTLSGVLRGGRVRNTWATCPGVGDSRGKPRVIPHTFGSRGET
jgi:hypothetical protein